MTTAEAILCLLVDCDIAAIPTPTGLRLDGPPDLLTPDLIDYIRPHKAALAALLRVDANGFYHSPDGDIWQRTPTGGWLLYSHPTKRIRESGTVVVQR
jgi:hypothetical protein